MGSLFVELEEEKLDKSKKVFVFKLLAGEMIVPAIFTIFTLLFLKNLKGIKSSDLLLINPLKLCLFSLVAIIVFQLLVKVFKSVFKDPNESNSKIEVLLSRNVICLIVLLVIYVLVIEPLGFFLSSMFFSISVMYITGIRKILILIGIPLSILVALYFLFDFWLKIPFPKLGLLFI
jgi:hypothetical protein